MYVLNIISEADKILKKLEKKNPEQLKHIFKKIKDIRKNPYGYKFLKYKLKLLNRVHIDTHFVLVFHIDHDKKSVTIFDFGHHDEVYGRKKK